MNAKEVKRKPMTSFTYGPCPITSLMPWKKDMGSDPTWQNSGWRKNAKVNKDVEKNIAWISFFNFIFQTNNAGAFTFLLPHSKEEDNSTEDID